LAKPPLLEVQDLKTYFFTRTGVVKAVDGVNLYLNEGETLGIVGESGCGKSMTALSIIRLVPGPAGRTVGGRILFEGEDLLKKSKREMRQIRGQRLSMILQDPMTSLNPVYSIGNQMMETVRIKARGSGRFLTERSVELMRRVNIPAPEVRMASFPHQMSGGMRQRVVGAIAITNSPKLLIADEPTTSLDATIQLQYLTLLKDLQRDTGMAIIFITHDFGIVAKMCDRVLVMYAGRVAETASVRDLYYHPSHPYTQALMKSVPRLEEDVDHLESIEGQPPALDDLPPGCTFAPRCPYVFDRCRAEFPAEFKVGEGHVATCWRLDESH